MRAVVLVAVLAAAALASPMIVVHKTVSEANVLVGGNVAVTTVAMNIGDEPATDFVLEDAGEKKSVAALAPQENVTIESTLTATALGELEVPVATATWAGADASSRLRATSNVVREEERDEKKHAVELGPRGFVNVVTATEYERLNSRYIKETIAYALFAATIVALPYAFYRSSLAQVDALLKEARKK